MNQSHKLKVWPEYYKELLTGRKTFEIRNNDRDFKIGDVLVLKEFDPIRNIFTKREIHKAVTYITDFNQADGFVVMGLSREFLSLI